MFFLGLGDQPGIKWLWWQGQRLVHDLGQKPAIAFISKAFFLVAGMAPCSGEQKSALVWGMFLSFDGALTSNHPPFLVASERIKRSCLLISSSSRGRVHLQASGPDPKHLLPAGNIKQEAKQFLLQVDSGDLSLPPTAPPGPSSA